MRKLLALVTILTSLVLVNGCSKCTRDPAPPAPALEPAATGPEEMHNNPGLDQPGANDPGGGQDDAQPPAGAEDESVD